MLLGFGLLAFWFFPLLILLPFKVIGAWHANRKMDAFFQEHAFRLRPIPPGTVAEGFVFTHLDIGNKIVHVRLFGFPNSREFVFTVPVPGLNADYLRHKFEDLHPSDQIEECDVETLRRKLAEAPATTSNRSGTRTGDPANLVVVGDYPLLISAFGGRWDETETITLETCWKNVSLLSDWLGVSLFAGRCIILVWALPGFCFAANSRRSMSGFIFGCGQHRCDFMANRFGWVRSAAMWESDLLGERGT